jgi:hypothetical protein
MRVGYGSSAGFRGIGSAEVGILAPAPIATGAFRKGGGSDADEADNSTETASAAMTDVILLRYQPLHRLP